MAKAPAFQFYANDFMDATSTWEANAVGLYVRCLCKQWTHGSIPADLKILARAVHCDRSELESCWPVVGPKFIDQGDGTLKNSRLEEVRGRQAEISEKRSEAGKAGAIAKANAREFASANAKQRKVKEKEKEKLEDEDEEEDKSLEKERASVPADFAEFYAAYPVRKAKGAALRAWAKLTASERPLCKPAIEAQLKAKHFLGGDGKNYVPHPATWLNERRWEDEVGGSSVLNMSGNPIYGKAEAEAEMKAIRIANGRDPVMGSVFDHECSRDLLVYRGVIKERA